MMVTNVPIAQIDPPSPVLRRFSETSVKFLELVDQIKEHGTCWQAPPARLLENGRIQIADGYRRYRAHIHAGVTSMSLNVIEDMDDAKYLAIQLQCNAGHEDTDPIDFARHLDRLRNMSNTEMPLSDLATICKCSKTWVSNILRLNHLHPRFAEMVRRNEVPVGNAMQLAKLPLAEQVAFVNDAKVLTTTEFKKIAQRALNDYREAIKQGKLELLGVDDLKPTMRDLRVIENEMDSPTHLPLMIASAGLTNPVEVAILALKWAFRVDDATIEERKEKMLDRERQRVNDATRRKHERDFLRFEERSQTTT